MVTFNFTQFGRCQVTTRKLPLARQQGTAAYPPYFGLIIASQVFINETGGRLDIVIKEQYDLPACESDTMIAGTGETGKVNPLPSKAFGKFVQTVLCRFGVPAGLIHNDQFTILTSF